MYAEILTLGGGNFNIVGYFDDTIEPGKQVGDFYVIGNISSIVDYFNNGFFDCLIIGIGYNHFDVRHKLYITYSDIIPFATIVASPTYIDESAVIGDGTVLYPGAIIDKNVHIGSNCILNLGVTVAHDSSIGTSTFCAPKVAIAGFSECGERCFLGIGSTVIDNIHIADDVIIGGGSTVHKSISESGTYVGVPARKIR